MARGSAVPGTAIRVGVRAANSHAFEIIQVAIRGLDSADARLTFTRFGFYFLAAHEAFIRTDALVDLRVEVDFVAKDAIGRRPHELV